MGEELKRGDIVVYGPCRVDGCKCSTVLHGSIGVVLKVDAKNNKDVHISWLFGGGTSGPGWFARHLRKLEVPGGRD